MTEETMDDKRDHLNILAPRATKPKLDALHRNVERVAGRPMSRRDALGLGGLLLLTAACGSTSTSSGSTTQPSGDPLAGKPVESHLEIFNWSQYDDPSTYKNFVKLPDETKAGLKIHETYYSSNDELLAKLNAGGTTFDIIVPSQNAVAQLIEEKKLLAMDASLIPNLKNLDPKFLKPAYDPTGQYHVIKDYGVTMIYYNNQIVTERPTTMLEFYNLLPKYVSKGRTNLLDGAEEVVPLALMALGLDPNTDSDADFSKVSDFLMSIRKGVTTIDASAYINDAIAGKIILGQGWNGDVRRIVQGRKQQGDINGVLLHEQSEIWSDNWCIPATAPDPVAAHAWINYLLEPATAVTEMEYHNYAIPIPDALSQLEPSLSDDPLFNVPKSYTDNYDYVLNVSPQVVQSRTQIYTQFRAG
jgi:spermidine/putrescine transport system substrate-binding protein